MLNVFVNVVYILLTDKNVLFLPDFTFIIMNAKCNRKQNESVRLVFDKKNSAHHISKQMRNEEPSNYLESTACVHF